MEHHQSYSKDLVHFNCNNLRLGEIIYQDGDDYVHLLVKCLVGILRNLPNNKIKLTRLQENTQDLTYLLAEPYVNTLWCLLFAAFFPGCMCKHIYAPSALFNITCLLSHLGPGSYQLWHLCCVPFIIITMHLAISIRQYKKKGREPRPGFHGVRIFSFSWCCPRL